MSADGSTFDFERNRARAARSAARASGFTTDSTSHTQAGAKLLDTRSLRLKKMRYNVIACANLLDLDARRGGFRVKVALLTLTYKLVSDPRPDDISRFCNAMRMWMSRREEIARYVWVGELQERGALHYHIVVWLRHGIKLPKPDKERVDPRGRLIAAWWPHGRSNIKEARSPVGYIAKYAGKLKTKLGNGGFAIPRGFRLFNRGGLDREDRIRMAWANLPGWLRERVTPDERCKRIPGGGFISRLTHDFWPSPWKISSVVRAGCGALVTIVPALPEGLELCLPSSFREF
jgi:hypothetical protein